MSLRSKSTVPGNVIPSEDHPPVIFIDLFFNIAETY